ncbi:MAG: CRISPR-associated protein Cas4 [Candidatus Woesearchaeota archaeon]
MAMISVTMLSSYLYCARKLYLEKVLGLREPPKKSLALGTVRHEVHELINNTEESIVSRVREGTGHEDILSMYKNAHSGILRDVIKKHKEKLAEFGLDQGEVFRQMQPKVMLESERRAENVSAFMEKHRIYGRELWDKLTPKILSEFRVESESLGLRGVVDQIEIHEGRIIPVELKTGRNPSDGAWPGHRIQLLSYMLLLSENGDQDTAGKEVGEGRIIYLDTGRCVPFMMNPFAEKEVKGMISKIADLITSKKLPPPCGNENKCRACGLREDCFNEHGLKARIRTMEPGKGGE